MHALKGPNSSVIVREMSTAAGLRLSLGVHPSPFGIALVIAADEALAALAFMDDAAALDAYVEAILRRWRLEGMAANLEITGALLDHAFAASRLEPTPLVLIGTDFERRVWRALLDVPFGRTVSHGDIARAIGAPSAARAVGGAIGRNNIAFVVPCHRVLGRDGATPGFRWGLATKRDMLDWESAHMVNSGLRAA